MDMDFVNLLNSKMEIESTIPQLAVNLCIGES